MYKDKEKQRACWRKYYYAHKEKHHERVNKIRDRNRSFVRQYKIAMGCSRCSEDSWACLEFHHVTGEKEQTIARMSVNGYSIETLLKEIEKCEVLCANCHCKEHRY